MELMNWLFFGPAKLIALAPYAGFGLGAALIALQAARSVLARNAFNRLWFRRPAVLAGLTWLIFNLYELQVAAVFAQTQAADQVLLRLDLTVITPILYVLSAFAAYTLTKPESSAT